MAASAIPVNTSFEYHVTTIPSTETKFQLTAKQIAAYVALWALIFACIRILADYSSIGAKGAYPISAAILTEVGLPVVIGLVFAAVGIAIGYLAGSLRRTRTIVFWCFLVGFLALPMFMATLVILAVVGVIPDL